LKEVCSVLACLPLHKHITVSCVPCSRTQEASAAVLLTKLTPASDRQ